MMKQEIREIKEYFDMLRLEHPKSKKHPQMSIHDRAAQFAPFAAVVGHEASVQEVARYIDKKKELDESEKARIDDVLMAIDSNLPETHELEVIYFQPDQKKSGGRYLSKIGEIIRLDRTHREVVFQDNTRISIEQIYRIVE